MTLENTNDIANHEDDTAYTRICKFGFCDDFKFTNKRIRNNLHPLLRCTPSAEKQKSSVTVNGRGKTSHETYKAFSKVSLRSPNLGIQCYQDEKNHFILRNILREGDGCWLSLPKKAAISRRHDKNDLGHIPGARALHNQDCQYIRCPSRSMTRDLRSTGHCGTWLRIRGLPIAIFEC